MPIFLEEQIFFLILWYSSVAAILFDLEVRVDIMEERQSYLKNNYPETGKTRSKR